MKNKIIIYITSLLIFSIFIANTAYWEWCKYSWQIDQCIAANDSGTTRSIEDFVCIVGTPEEIAYQVVLDQLFKELDDEMDQYIQDLETEKSRYFGKSRQKNFIDWLNEIDLKKNYFFTEYSKICGSKIMEEVISCNEGEKTANRNATNYFQEADCMSLINKKLDVFDEVTFSILMLNKQQVKADDKKTYDQWERTNYDTLLDIMMVNLGYAERIWQKWPSKIQNAY